MSIRSLAHPWHEALTKANNVVSAFASSASVMSSDDGQIKELSLTVEVLKEALLRKKDGEGRTYGCNNVVAFGRELKPERTSTNVLVQCRKRRHECFSRFAELHQCAPGKQQQQQQQ